ncbi:hypothetical protein [Flavobacterium macrobrachii]|uniref:hypothetical protein n=1 Tax=Flavobacterium macrobrachii TaxID=591204 RepID=UPI003F6E6BF8
MKKQISRILATAILSASLFMTSCSDDENNSNKSTFVLDRENLKGEINDGTVTLESGTYKLTGKLIVKETAKLVIKPGVIIEATDATTDGLVRYIAIAQGGEIDVQGTASNPVIMTSSVKQPGSWGGLVICGKAPINKGLTASAEVSELTYGGAISNDNSGSIRYLRLEYTGYAYNSEKEFNGLSLFGVGSGTLIEYVQSYEGSDDAFEWFGGTVNAKYLVAFNGSNSVGDDIFDWTEGWTGTGEYWYGKRTNAGNRGIEADNNSNNHTATPISNPTLRNITLIGNGDTGSEPQAIKLRVGTNVNFDNLVLSNWKTGFDIQHNESLAFVTAGSLKATNVRFDNVTTKSKGTNTTSEAIDVTSVYTENANATGAGNGTGIPTWATGWTRGL